MTQPIVAIQNLSVDFENGAAPLRALQAVSFSVFPRQFVAVLGPSGCGKTTLLQVLAGLVEPSQGEVRFFVEGAAQNRAGRPQVGMVFQDANLMPWRSVEMNIALPLELAGASRQQARRKAGELIELVGLQGFAESLPRDLSGGMAQRVAIARALAHDPEILLFDEPFGALDALTRQRMGTELLSIWQARRKTVIMVTHDIDEALYLADRVIVLSPRPGTVRLDLAVDLERPRLAEMRYTASFGDLARRVRNSIG